MLTWSVLTPAGLGAVTVVQLAGEALPQVLRDRKGRVRAWPGPGRSTWARLVDRADRPIDDVVVVGRPGGAEIHTHGGPGLLPALARALQAPASAFSPSVEPAPASLAQARALLSARSGPLRCALDSARDAVARGALPPEAEVEIRRCLGLAGLGEQLLRPPVVRIVGRPNAGKSSLFNALLGERRALVSPHRGTTRDSVTARFLLATIPVSLEDTAGDDGLRHESGADLVLHLLSAADERVVAGPQVVAVCGRADLHPTAGGVSGLTGLGVAELASRIADRLGLSADPEDHARAPLDSASKALLAGALDLPRARRPG